MVSCESIDTEDLGTAIDLETDFLHGSTNHSGWFSSFGEVKNNKLIWWPS